MRKVWYKENPALLVEMKEEIKDDFPNLHFYESNGVIVVEGSFPIRHDKKSLDRYSIKITFLKDYPKSIPIVEEVGGRIPRTLDRHMNEKGEACLFLPEQRSEIWPIGSTFLEFLNCPVHNFFLGQSLVERGEAWPFGVWDHGVRGIRDYYVQLFGTEDMDIVIKFMLFIIAPKIKGHWPCPCGNGKRLRGCHFPFLLELRDKIPRNVAQRSLQFLLEAKSGKRKLKDNLI
ncbi:MAG: hypothetical protein OS130_10880 [Thermodesulfobacteriota bacterium]|jgi:hypothetical protein|nr:MAG: hypothetical protein OS130_10880 [Thermodesulfobacteriota bacterium]